MLPVSIVGVFCEDIREEKSGQDTLIGLLPDNLNVAALPGFLQGGTPIFPKLGLYVRAHLEKKPKTISVTLFNTDGSVVISGGWESHMLDRAFNDAKQNQLPLVGLIQKIVVSPLPLPRSGKILAVATVNDVEHIVAALNVIVSHANASALPVSQSAPTAQGGSSQP
jgi:hypothetical protein